MNESWLYGAIGGVLIGLSAAWVLLIQGRIAGISGVLRRAVVERGRDRGRWRLAFVVGLLLAGIFSRGWTGAPSESSASTATLVLAGLLVGFGTQLGSGCTSGHGVCGLGRASKRSFAAVVTFLLSGAVTVYLGRHIFHWIG